PVVVTTECATAYALIVLDALVLSLRLIYGEQVSQALTSVDGSRSSHSARLPPAPGCRASSSRVRRIDRCASSAGLLVGQHIRQPAWLPKHPHRRSRLDCLSSREREIRPMTAHSSHS